MLFPAGRKTSQSSRIVPPLALTVMDPCCLSLPELARKVPFSGGNGYYHIRYEKCNCLLLQIPMESPSVAHTVSHSCRAQLGRLGGSRVWLGSSNKMTSHTNERCPHSLPWEALPSFSQHILTMVNDWGRSCGHFVFIFPLCVACLAIQTDVHSWDLWRLVQRSPIGISSTTPTSKLYDWRSGDDGRWFAMASSWACSCPESR